MIKMLTNYDELFYVLIGFLLGIIGSRISDFFKKRDLKKEFKECAIAELSDVCVKLVAVDYGITMKLQQLSKEKVEWMINILDKFDDNVLSKVELRFKNILKVQFKKYSDEIEELSQILGGDFNRAFHFKKYRLKYINQNIHLISLFNRKVQKKIICIIGRFDSLHADMDRFNFYFDKTFDSALSETNRQIIESNQIGLYKNMVQYIEVIISDITELLNYLK